jgi:hypothetical protein
LVHFSFLTASDSASKIANDVDLIKKSIIFFLLEWQYLLFFSILPIPLLSSWFLRL